jgi:hypothetical protein
VVQDTKGMTSLHQTSLHMLKRVKKVCGGAGHEGDDQPAPNLLHEFNMVKRVCGGAGSERDDQPAPSFSARVS